MSGPPTISVAELKASVGKEAGVSSWTAITQGMIDRFADLSGDHQFIHVDPVLAARSPLGTTVAHGFLTLSLLSVMAIEVRSRIAGTSFGLNYGFDKVRFLNPVPVNSRVRGRFTFAALAEQGEKSLLLTHSASVEIEGAAKPALVADWLTMVVLE